MVARELKGVQHYRGGDQSQHGEVKLTPPGSGESVMDIDANIY